MDDEHLAPRMIQSMEILQMSIATLIARIKKELANPFLVVIQSNQLNDFPDVEPFIEDEEPVPELRIEKNESGDLIVRIIPDLYPQLSINENPEGQDLENDQSKNMLKDAKWFLESIEQRKTTLVRVAQEIASQQSLFLNGDYSVPNPLMMSTIADKIFVAVTTLSRAVDEKWIETPNRSMALRELFDGGASCAAMLRRLGKDIQKLIDSEDKSAPLSDEAIVKKLYADHGNVARRTVTKCRIHLKIPSSRQRKDDGNSSS